MTLFEESVSDISWLTRSSEIAFALAEVAEARTGSTPLSSALGMGEYEKSDVTKFFLFDLPPNASIYLSDTGNLGGETYDTIAGFYGVIGADPGTQADHISSLFSLLGYILLSEAKLANSVREENDLFRNTAIARARAVLVEEHLLPWLPAYLVRAKEVAPPSIAPWTSVALEFFAEQIDNIDSLEVLNAPGVASVDDRLDRDLVEWLMTPASSGLILSNSDLSFIARETGLGKRVGGRRFILKNLLDTDKATVLVAIQALAGKQSELFAAHAKTFASLQQWSLKAHVTSSSVSKLIGK